MTRDDYTSEPDDRLAWERDMNSPERQAYSDAAEKELALIEGYDPFSGEDLATFFRRTADEALALDVPTLEEIGL